MYMALLKRIHYRSQYRGTKEADFLIGGFVTWALAQPLSDPKLQELDRILMWDDPLLLDHLRSVSLGKERGSLSHAFQMWQSCCAE